MNQRNKFVRFILRVIDIIVAGRSGRSVRWDRAPYQKATEAQKRSAGLLMALLPIGFYFSFKNSKFLGAWVDSMIYGHHSIGWLYLAWIGVVCFGVFVMAKIAPKIPLFISIPAAVVAWPIFLWWGWTR